jgi:hypothetical protein
MNFPTNLLFGFAVNQEKVDLIKQRIERIHPITITTRRMRQCQGARGFGCSLGGSYGF